MRLQHWILSGLSAVMTLAGCAGPTVGARLDADSTLKAQSAPRSLVQRWQDEVVYFAMLDRFCDGDRTNDAGAQPSNPGAYHGGDLQGLIDKLDYLQDLGVTTIWVSPLLKNDDGELEHTGLWGYHGYWTKDFSKIDARMGSLDKAKELVAQAHAHGMKVLLDIVCNQAGYEFPVKDPRYAGFFHQNGDIKNWDDQWWLENGSLFGLPDFAQEKPEVATFLTTTYIGWARTLGLDGFRVDALKHVPKSFWTQFNTAVSQQLGSSFLTLGEVLHGDPGYCADYQRTGKVMSLFDFPLYYTMTDVFAKGASMKGLGARFAQDSAYADPELLSPFLDNHDVPRFMSQAGGDETKLRLALACLLTIRGVPTLYYGTEVGMTGGTDPDNRRDMAWGKNESLRQYVKRLIGVRKASPALQHGRQLEMWQDDQVYGYMRQSPDAEAVVLLNNSTQTQSRTVPLRSESRMADGTVLVDSLTGDRMTIANHQISVSLGSRQARILVPAARR